MGAQEDTKPGWREGQDGADVLYRESLRPPAVIYLVALSLATITGVAYGAAYGAGAGALVGVLLGGLAVFLLTSTTVRLQVDDRVLRAGRARLPLRAIAGISVLEPEEMTQVRRHGDPRDYLVLRPWRSRRGVAVELSDDRDPHPRWIISSRHPGRLSDAIVQARAAHVDE